MLGYLKKVIKSNHEIFITVLALRIQRHFSMCTPTSISEVSMCSYILTADFPIRQKIFSMSEEDILLSVWR